MKTVKNAIAVAFVFQIAVGHAEPLDDYWSLTSGEDASSGQLFMSLQQESADTILDEYGKTSVRPVLQFQCAPGSNESVTFRINWHRFISSFNTEAGFRVDGGKAFWIKLGVDRSNTITLSRSASDVEKFALKIVDAKILEIEIAPYSEAPVFAKFDVSTFTAAMDSLRESCN